MNRLDLYAIVVLRQKKVYRSKLNIYSMKNPGKVICHCCGLQKRLFLEDQTENSVQRQVSVFPIKK
jgi:hypothetical protein